MNYEKKSRKFVGLFCGMLIVISFNFVFIPEEVKSESGPPWVNLDEMGFSSDFIDTLSTELYCPRFVQNTNWETLITLSNPSENKAFIDIFYFDEDGYYIDDFNTEIESKDTIDFISTDHGIQNEAGSIIISSNIPIFGNIIYYSEYCAASEPLQSNPSTTLYCSGFYQSVDWETWICINNINGTSSSITLTYYDENGNSIDTFIDTLSPKEQRYFRPSVDGITDTFGSVIVQS
ncbi:MAG: hypothetical protein JSV49_05925, partial [Thermoplasmata archaeon]